jgi:hypothetical protein
MLDCLLAVARALLTIFASRSDLIPENLALRQQVAVLRRKQPRLRLRLSDRLFWLALHRRWPRWNPPRRASSLLRLARRRLTIPLDESVAAVSSWRACALAARRTAAPAFSHRA